MVACSSEEPPLLQPAMMHRPQPEGSVRMDQGAEQVDSMAKASLAVPSTQAGLPAMPPMQTGGYSTNYMHQGNIHSGPHPGETGRARAQQPNTTKGYQPYPTSQAAVGNVPRQPYHGNPNMPHQTMPPQPAQSNDGSWAQPPPIEHQHALMEAQHRPPLANLQSQGAHPAQYPPQYAHHGNPQWVTQDHQQQHQQQPLMLQALPAVNAPQSMMPAPCQNPVPLAPLSTPQQVQQRHGVPSMMSAGPQYANAYPNQHHMAPSHQQPQHQQMAHAQGQQAYYAPQPGNPNAVHSYNGSAGTTAPANSYHSIMQQGDGQQQVSNPQYARAYEIRDHQRAGLPHQAGMGAVQPGRGPTSDIFIAPLNNAPGVQHASTLRCQVDGCHEMTLTRRALVQHMRFRHPNTKVTGSKIECPLCHKVFGRRADLGVHTRTVHLAERNYICPICSRSFGVKSSMRRHIQSLHPGQSYDPYSCDVEGCTRTFGSVNALRSHSRVHRQRPGSKASSTSSQGNTEQAPAQAMSKSSPPTANPGAEQTEKVAKAEAKER